MRPDISARFFRNIWRFNAVAIAIVAMMGIVIGTVALAALVYEGLRPLHKASIVPAKTSSPPNVAQKEVIGRFTKLPGTALYWAPVRTRFTGRVSYRSKIAHSQVDRIVYDPTNERSHALIGKRPVLLIEAQPLRPKTPEGRQGPARAVLVRYVIDDTNANDRLTLKDRQRIAIATARGDDLRDVLVDVVGFHGWAVTDTNIAIVFVETKTGLEAVAIELVSRKIASRNKISAAPATAE